MMPKSSLSRGDPMTKACAEACNFTLFRHCLSMLATEFPPVAHLASLVDSRLAVAGTCLVPGTATHGCLTLTKFLSNQDRFLTFRCYTENRVYQADVPALGYEKTVSSAERHHGPVRRSRCAPPGGSHPPGFHDNTHPHRGLSWPSLHHAARPSWQQALKKGGILPRARKDAIMHRSAGLSVGKCFGPGTPPTPSAMHNVVSDTADRPRHRTCCPLPAGRSTPRPWIVHRNLGRKNAMAGDRSWCRGEVGL